MRERSSFSRVESVGVAVLAMSALLRFGWEVGPNLSHDCLADCVRLAAIHDCDADTGFTSHLRRAQLGAHAPAPEVTVPITQLFHLRRELSDRTHQALPLAIRNVESVYIGKK